MRKSKHTIILILTLLIVVFSPIMAFAHDTYYLQVLIDDKTMSYTGSVIDDKASFWNAEAKHAEAQLGDFHSFGTSGPQAISSGKDVDTYKKISDLTKVTENFMLFSFPGKENKGDMALAKNNASKKDSERAYLIKDTLLGNLNNALIYINGGTKFSNVDQLTKVASALASGKTVTTDWGTYSISYENDKCTIKRNSDGQIDTMSFLYRINKGYKNGSLTDSSNKAFYSTDAEYITWQQLMLQGNYLYFEKGLNASSENAGQNLDELSKMVVNFLGYLESSIENALGLYPVNDLIFNEGARDTSQFIHGAINKSWDDSITLYHLLFQGLAWALITLALLRMLIQKNIATVNVVMKINMMEATKDLLVTGFILANSYPIINLFMYLNTLLVSVFHELAPFGVNYANVMANQNPLSQIILAFFFLAMSAYMNFVYILRGITIAILIASAPLFIVTIAFGGKWKMMFDSWIRELVANVFLQSFHAFIIGLFVVLQVNTRGIETMVISFALIPLTDFFRGLIMQNAGGLAGQVGFSALSASRDVMNASSRSLGNGGKSGDKSKNNDKSKNRESDSHSSSEGNKAGESTKITNPNSSEALGKSKGFNQERGFTKKEESALDSGVMQMSTASDGSASTSSTINDGTKSSTAIPGGKSISSSESAESKLSWGQIKEGWNKTASARGAIGSAGKVAMGVGMMGMGAGLALATGHNGGASQSLNLAREGATRVKGVLGEVSDKSKSMMDEKRTNNTMAENTAKGATQNLADEDRRQNTSESISNYRNWNGQGDAPEMPNDIIDYEEQKDGSHNVKYDSIVTEERGLIQAYEGGQLRYDMTKLSSNEQESLTNLSNAYEASTNVNSSPSQMSQAKDYLKSNGVDYAVHGAGNNQMAIKYNKEGLNALGMTSIKQTDEGFIVNKAVTHKDKTLNIVNKTPKFEYDPNKQNSNGRRQ